MTFEIALAFALLIAALTVFALEIYPVDFVALSLLALIMLLGPILSVTPEQAISGFSNPATITVLAMFVLSGGVYRTGMINILAHRVVRLAGESETRQLLTIMLVVGPISMVINNTAAVAILIPMAITLARERGRAPSKLLMPLSFFSQLAGVVTLIGTSTNILASALSDRAGHGAFGMFDFAKIGLLIFATGSLYILLVGRKFLPSRRSETEITEAYRIREYLTEVLVLEGSPLVGKTLVQSRLNKDFDVQVLEILRNERRLRPPLAHRALQANDILFVQANQEQLFRIKDAEGLAIEPEVHFGDRALKGEMAEVLELVIGPNSDLIGGTLRTTNFANRYNCTVIAMQKHGRLRRERLSDIRLEFGDTLLLWGAKFQLDQMRREPGFIVTEQAPKEVYRTRKIPVAGAIVAAVVIVASMGVPILVTSIVGCVLMVMTGCLKMTELHESIRWDVIFLLAGVIPLGLALENSGAAHLLASIAERAAHYVPPVVVIGIFYVITMFLTELISNNAAVVVMIPIAGATATALGLDPKALYLASMFAASTSFSTPVGYQTNTMVYGPGGYRFLDFLRVGGPLNLLLAVVTPIYIYYFWGI